MNSKAILTGLLGASAAVPATAAQTAAKQPAKPNIVIIYTDDMGVGDVSMLNNGWVTTPNIDRIAKEGLVIEGYYSAAPVSSASRVGLTTGMFPMEWGIHTFLNNRKYNAACEQNDYLSASAPSMARQLKAAGYHTGHFGKWHMGGGRDVTDAPAITQFGFDEYASTWESPDPDPKLTASNWIWSAKDEVKRWERTDYFIDKTLDFLSRHKGEPCFVNLWPDDMHTPWVPDEESERMRKGFDSKENFEQVIAQYDRQIGRFLDELDKRGLAENTIVIFSSDNGPAPSFSQIRANGLRGQKNSLYEAGIRMPMAIRWPGVIKPGTRDVSSIICSVDLFPSLCRIAGAKLPKGYKGSGEDRSSVLLGKPSVRNKDLMWTFGHTSSFNFPNDKYNRSPSLAIRHGNWKLLINTDGTNAELYDLIKDKNETTNVAGQHPEIVRDMTAKVMKWWEARPGKQQ